MLSTLLGASLALAPVQIDLPSEQPSEISKLIVQARDQLVHSMASDGAFEPQEERYSNVLEAIQLVVDKGPSSEPFGVALVLWKEGEVRDPEVIIGAILHNVASPQEIEEKFGSNVSDMVAEMAGTTNLVFRSDEAKLIALADKVYNLRELETPREADWAGLGATPWTQIRRDNYYSWAEQVTANLRGVSAALEAQLDALFDQHRAEVAERQQ